MGQSIDAALTTQFSDMVHTAAQQMKSRFKPYIKYKPMTGDNWAYDGLGSVEAREASGRNESVVFSDIEHNRRKIARSRYYVALPIDGFDKLGMLIDPNEGYVQAVLMAMQRQLDRVVASAAFATVYTGRDFSTSVTFANDGGLTVDATSGLTYEKLLEINKNFVDGEVGNDMDIRKCMAITGEEEEALMKESELISGDYTRQFAIEKGELQRAAGLDIIKFGGSANNPILDVTSSVRSNIVLAEGGICVGVSKEIDLKIQDRTDLVDTQQVIATFYLGAVRTEGKLVQKLTTTDA